MSEQEQAAPQETQDALAEAEAERQRGQAQAHTDHLEGTQDEADARAEAAQDELDIDPASHLVAL